MEDPIQMKRKVQQLGSSTLAVTMPAEWVERQQIEKGDEVILQDDEVGGSILVVPEEPILTDSDATIDADALSPDALERAIVTQYVLCRQLIHVTSEESLEQAHHDAIARAERALMGLGIVERKASSVTIRCSVAPDDFDLPTLLERISRTESTMRTDTITAMVTADNDLARSVTGRYEQVEKLFFLFLRLVIATYRNPRLNQTVGLDTGFPLIGYRSVAQDILLMADVNKQIATLVLDSDGPALDSDTADILRALGNEIDTAVETTMEAITELEYETTETARDQLVAVSDRIVELNDHLDAERPEPLLELQRAAVLLEQHTTLTEDIIAVATRLSFRTDPEFVDTD